MQKALVCIGYGLAVRIYFVNSKTNLAWKRENLERIFIEDSDEAVVGGKYVSAQMRPKNPGLG